MAIDRTTIMMDEILRERMLMKVEETGVSQTDFINKAILNQLESEGDFEARDLLEKGAGA